MDSSAYHEAGHAGLAIHSGVEFDYVTIESPEPGLYGANGEPMVFIAGPAAENRYRENAELPLVEIDPEGFLEHEEVDPAVYYLAVSRGLHDDYREALDLLWDGEDQASSINIAKRRLREIEQRCNVLIEQFWKRIDLIARTLEQQGTIVYVDAQRLFRSD